MAYHENKDCFCLIGDYNSIIGYELDAIDTIVEDVSTERLCVDVHLTQISVIFSTIQCVFKIQCI